MVGSYRSVDWMSSAICCQVGGVISVSCLGGGEDRSAGLVTSHPHFTPWLSARPTMALTRWMVFGASLARRSM
jgi:hypothetical protein